MKCLIISHIKKENTYWEIQKTFNMLRFLGYGD